MRFLANLLILLVLNSFGFKVHSGVSDTIYRSFWHPMYQGERLNYCSLDGKECGKKIADRYCHTLGYSYAQQYLRAPNVGLTHFLDGRARCKGWRCSGFMTISCATASSSFLQSYHYREKRFVVPAYNHYRVDWCYVRAKKCGAIAANSFCKRLGFMRAKQFAREDHVGVTQTIGSQELCFGRQCRGFKEIICFR